MVDFEILMSVPSVDFHLSTDQKQKTAYVISYHILTPLTLTDKI